LVYDSCAVRDKIVAETNNEIISFYNKCQILLN